MKIGINGFGRIGRIVFRILEKIANEEMYEEKGLLLGDKDLVILAAPSVPGVEVIAVNVLDLLYRTGAKVINISGKKISSMHAQEEDLKTIISMLQPKFYLPVKGYYKDLITNATLANNMQIGLNHNNIFVFDNGMVAKFVDEKFVAGEEQIQVGELMVDGLGIFDAGSVVINDRNKLADDGVIILGITIDSETKEIVAGPDVQTRGLVFIKESDHLVKDVAELYVNVVKDTFNNNKLDINEKRVHIRDKISKYVKKETGKDPMVLSMVVEI
jgi:ribonuclease J